MVVILTLGILFGLTIVALVVVVTVSVIKFKKIKKDIGHSDKESFHIENKMSKYSSSSDENEPAEKSERTPQSQTKAPYDSKELTYGVVLKKENKDMSASQDSNDHEEEGDVVSSL
ncbi:uncharacterized protein LOC143137278 [Alosa pseudoharengus]|uniref:uncharacterized protein LOC143137278 n=1 Tax=Alosa pseudoharengus TaxID=34774 RepID=UPI003F8BB5F2